MELNFGIFLLVSFPCILLNSHIASCHRHLPPPPTPTPDSYATTSPPTSSISEPPSSSTPSIVEAPASSPTASEAPQASTSSPMASPIESGAPTSSPIDSGAPESSPSASGAPESSPVASGVPESSPTGSGAPKSLPASPIPYTSPPASGTPETSSPSDTTPPTDGNGQSSDSNFGFGFGFGKNGFNLDSLKGFGSMNAGSVKKFCDTTENPTLCSNSILPFLKGSGSMNWGSALEMEIDAFLSLSAKACATLQASLNSPSTSASAVESLQACLDIYQAAGDDLKQAKDALKTNDVGLLSSMLSGAITDLGTCDDAFKEAGEESPLDNNMVASMNKLVDNCFDISSAMRT